MLLLSPFQEVPSAPCDQPVLIGVSEATQKFVAVFDDENELEALMLAIGVGDYKIKRVTDVNDFVASIVEQGLRVMLNPHFHGDRVRWTELFPPGQTELTPEQQASRELRIRSEEAERN